jgi:methyl-accepting chemotaxis protein
MLNLIPTKIATRSLILCVAATGFLILNGAATYYVQHHLVFSVAQTRTISTALRNHTITDMVHDGLRSIAYAAILGTEIGATQDSIKKDLEDYISTASKAIESNKALKLPDDERVMLNDAGVALDDYIAETKLITEIALQDRTRALAMLPDFEIKFHNLERVLSGVGDQLEADTVAINQSSVEFESLANLAMFVIVSSLCRPL